MSFWQIHAGLPKGHIVSKKPLNKIRDNKRMAEEVEKSGLAKGNLSRKTGSGHRAGETL